MSIYLCIFFPNLSKENENASVNDPIGNQDVISNRIANE
jgi:hypothetical protein